ncbi:efflux RND transporter periplasmic adaptor subunit [Algoriphagus boritolerans]|uniref:RND family efflux transporter, MFP subunit n=2 Tax=Algoriphagus TaxID=246875 RepID=A0A1H5WCP6_9BACT|nr:efflux RND transporter periplasmic adaptor subunit [Algoriphagus boritolerans]SEF96587.1 RND family efflux transporter, MFP subunit [Algoriphagus boritolerans DSM 17298 = JCM 18970]
MKPLIKFLPIILATILQTSCAQEEGVEAKKTKLAELKSQVGELNTEIRTLESEIAKLDPEFAAANKKSILITTAAARKGEFAHFVEVTGSVLSKKNVSISAETAGRILEVPVMEGARVSKGQILARIDAESILRNIEELENSLDLATTIFEKQQRLWNQKIGTEIQYLEAKNRKEGLEKNLASIKTQLDKAYVRAPFNGTVESVKVRMGELAQPGVPMFEFVGESDLYIQADVSESFVGVLRKGDTVNVDFPSLKKSITSRVSAVGGVINPNNRTFTVEVLLPTMPDVKPNMISVLKIKDYQNSSSVLVPAHLILADNQGDYVFIVENQTAKKKYVKRGLTANNETEILEGLTGSETLVDKGFREVGDNFSVNIAQL